MNLVACIARELPARSACDHFRQCQIARGVFQEFRAAGKIPRLEWLALLLGGADRGREQYCQPESEGP